MGHIFISYSHKDTKYAHGLAGHLKTMGFDVWIDERLDYGSQWPHEIQKQLDSCDAFLLIMSPRSFASDWVQSELQRAKRKLKPIFPLLLEREESWLSVQSTQYYDVRGGLFPDDRFYAAIKRVISINPQNTIWTRLPKSTVKTNTNPPRQKTGLIVTIIIAIATVITACAAIVILPLSGWILSKSSTTQQQPAPVQPQPFPTFTPDLNPQIPSATASNIPTSLSLTPTNTPTNIPTSTLSPTFPLKTIIIVTSTPDLHPAGFYNVIPKHSGLCLGIWGGSLEHGALVIQATCDGTPNQRWELRPQGAGYYNVLPTGSGKCLGIFGALTAPATDVIQSVCDGTQNQLWRLRPEGANYYNVLPKHTDECLGILSGSYDYAAHVVQAVCDGSDNQLWKFISVP
jgi:TIR domain/Ricin-type beta-trefoil lectin domain